MSRIVLTGHVCIDRNRTESGAYTAWGSPVLYMADYWQRHTPQKPVVVTRYGTDFAVYARDFTLAPPTPQETQTLEYENHLPDGGTRHQHCFAVEYAAPPVLDVTMRHLLAEAQIAVLAPLLPNYTCDFVRQWAALLPAKCLKILIVQGYLRRVDEHGLVHAQPFTDAATIIPFFDVVVFSEEDISQPVQMAGTWQKMGAAYVVMTQGAGGATIFDAVGQTHIAVEPVADEDILDSVGCGDVFAAALAQNFAITRDMVGAVKFAHNAARQKLCHPPERGRRNMTERPARELSCAV